MSNFGTYTPPVIEDSDEYKPFDHYGNAVVAKVNEYKPSIVTPNSKEGAPGVIVDLVDLNEGKVYRNVLMMTGAIVDGFKAHVNAQPIVVSWEKRKSSSGRTYAAPLPATDEQIKAAEAYYAKNGDPFKQEFTTVDAEPPF